MQLKLAKLHQEIDTTIIYVAHDQVEVMTLADKIVVLKVRTPLELYNKSANMFMAGFIGSQKKNFLMST